MKWNAHNDNAFTVLLNIQGKVKIPTMSQPSFSSCAQKNANFFQSISIFFLFHSVVKYRLLQGHSSGRQCYHSDRNTPWASWRRIPCLWAAVRPYGTWSLSMCPISPLMILAAAFTLLTKSQIFSFFLN